MKLIVNDANVLIDMVELKILPHFFQLEMKRLIRPIMVATYKRRVRCMNLLLTRCPL